MLKWREKQVSWNFHSKNLENDFETRKQFASGTSNIYALRPVVRSFKIFNTLRNKKKGHIVTVGE